MKKTNMRNLLLSALMILALSGATMGCASPDASSDPDENGGTGSASKITYTVSVDCPVSETTKTRGLLDDTSVATVVVGVTGSSGKNIGSGSLTKKADSWSGSLSVSETGSATFSALAKNSAGAVLYAGTSEQVLYGTSDSVSIALASASGLCVTYDGNGSESGTVPVDGTCYSSGDAARTLGNSGSLSKAGYIFTGWNTAADGTGTNYAVGNTLPVSANLPLYAVWLDKTVLAIDGTSVTGCNTSYSGSIIIPPGITTIGSSAFKQCIYLTSVTIPDSVTSIGDSAFYNCVRILSVNIPASVTIIENCAFYQCESLTSVTIPDAVTSIGYSAFSGCTGLTSLTIPGSVTSLGDSAFSVCTGLTSVTIPGSLKSIASNAFLYCTGLTSVTIPGSVTSIGINAFWGCTGLESATIPGSVTSIGDNVFNSCTKLASVTVNAATPPTLGSSVFNKCSSSLKIYVPSASLDTYKAATYWKALKLVSQ